MKFVKWYRPVSFLLMIAVTTSIANAQIVSSSGDGVLNAPYRGTINSIREATMDIGYGEVRTWSEPKGNNSYFHEMNSIEVWNDEASGGQPWDRSVLRLYNGIDASGTEIDLTGTDTYNRQEVFVS
ncbi:MAG: hypothetical protein ACYTBZ_00005, partial [Planctomycetota bacterium]